MNYGKKKKKEKRNQKEKIYEQIIAQIVTIFNNRSLLNNDLSLANGLL